MARQRAARVVAPEVAHPLEAVLVEDHLLPAEVVRPRVPVEAHLQAQEADPPVRERVQ